MKKFIITAKLKKNDDITCYVRFISIAPNEKYKIQPSIVFEKDEAGIYPEDKAKFYFKELKKIPELYFDLMEVKDNE